MKLNRLTTYLLALAIGYSGQAMGTPDPERETPRTVASDNSCFSASTEASITSGINDTIRPINQAAGISNTSGYDVGSPKGTFSVNSSGAAIYNISIDAPNGGGLSPAIGVGYNSQSGNGLAGYGFNITGLSCITRGSKDLYHDSTISGTKFSSSDALFLNGQRLVIKTGAYGCNGSSYNPEGNPYTTVTLHGDSNSPSSWFQVTGTDGKTYQLGSTTDSRLTFVSRKNATCVAAWYVSQITDAHGNLVRYHYTTTNYNIRPSQIEYGLNTLKPRGLVNVIDFSYGQLGDSYVRPFAIGDRQGRMDVYLSKITTLSNGSVYRTYTLSYDSSSDGTSGKYFRLTRVGLANGSGKSVPPITINWNYLPALSLQECALDVQTSYPSNFIEENSKTFAAVDVNNDGISDIIRLSPGNYVLQNYGGQVKKQGKTFLFVSLSKRDANGKVTYGTPRQFDLPPVFSVDDLTNIIGGIHAMDLDGDGYNDLFIPYYSSVNGNNGESCTVLYGSSFATGRNELRTLWLKFVNCDHTPLMTAFDSNGDGKDDILYIEDMAKDGYYNGGIVSFQDKNSLQDPTVLKLKFDKDPKKLFAGDFNHDNLTDIIVFYDGGYKIYYNNGGGLSTVKFSEANTAKGSSLGNKHRMAQGDFDGDGMPDFAYYQGSSKYGLAINNGNGTFAVNDNAATLNVNDHSSRKDDGRFSMQAYDFDHDGRCDLLLNKANYVHHGGLRSKNTFTNTQTVFARSTGSSFVSCREVLSEREPDADEGHIFLGDFTGDGCVESASFGKNLLIKHDESDDKIHVYHSGGNMAVAGKVASFTDGFGRTTAVTYKSGTDPSVYTRGAYSSYPVNSYTLPIHLVSDVRQGNGAAGDLDTRYSYGDLRLHIAGKGWLGFGTAAEDDNVLGSRVTTTVDKWDTDRWIPVQTTVTDSVDGNSSKEVSTVTVENVAGTNTYFAYTSRKIITDLDGNTSEATAAYDIAKGVPTMEAVSNGVGMYRKVTYGNYVSKAGMWMPETMEKVQKHKDDAAEFVQRTKYKYNDRGDVTTTVENAGGELQLTTTDTYDVYGNVLTSVSSGKDVGNNKKSMEYDATGRFVTKTAETATKGVNTFTYDAWGNLLTENDLAYPQVPLTVRHEYDGWGREVRETAPTGAVTETLTGWGTNNGKKYFVETKSGNGAWVRTWYDNSGHEVLSESMGPASAAISKSISYNGRGQVVGVSSTTGKLRLTETFSYDGRGRLISDIHSSGRQAAYSYANRTVTSVVGGRTYTRTTDAWGNVVRTTDPLSEVEYTYSSCGKPARVTVNGNARTATSFSYNEAGFQVRMDDPDAGATTYSYSADGKLMTQTNARGVITRNRYDDKGRLASSNTGGIASADEYGTVGFSTNRLVKVSLGNNSTEYTYDRYGRVVMEKRNVSGHGPLCYHYTYNDKDQLVQTVYPNGLMVSYTYDTLGNKVQTKAGNDVIYKLESYTGLSQSSSFKGLSTTRSYGSSGYETSVALEKGQARICEFKEQYDGKTGNMLSRQASGSPVETFSYDALDRLTSVRQDSKDIMSVKYDSYGNIISKTGIGSYYYETERPHAVSRVDNDGGLIPSDKLTTEFNAFNRIARITDSASGYTMTFDCGPDGERWSSVLAKNGKTVRTTVYGDDYEQVTEGGVTREYYYLDGNTIVIRQDGKFKSYQAFTDNLGSMLSVHDGNGAKCFEAAYDAWGRQTVKVNTIGLHRGYCGHEMLPEFDIINMNGRLYDPVLGRFLSPDNFVQEPGNSQNFNRYSYCLNNPLKYIDPSGEMLWFIPVIAGAIIGAYTGASIQSGTAAFWHWSSNAWKGAIAGGIIGATIGYGVSAALAPSGGVTGLTTTIKGVDVVTKSAGITSSILNSGSINIAYNAITGGDWDGAWKAGMAGLATGAWAITGGFGMVKGLSTASRLGKLAGKLGYQMIGTVSQSIGNNWASHKGIFSKVTFGVGPINLTLGRGQKILQWQNNIANIATNLVGITNLAFGGKIRFNVDNLSPIYYGGIKDKFFGTDTGYGAYAIFGCKNPLDTQDDIIVHEIHHLWQSRAMSNSFLLNYGLQGIIAEVMGGDFLDYLNYYEQIAYESKWFEKDN